VYFPPRSYEEIADISVLPSIKHLLDKIGDMGSGEGPIDIEFYSGLRAEGMLNVLEVEWLIR
jgi:hypothetical protein